MRKVDVSSVNSTTGMPVKSGTIDHLQLAYQEVLTSIAKNLIGRDNDTTRAYILFGLVNSGSTGSMNVSAGAVYFNGEVFLVDAFTLTVAQTAVASIATTYYSTNADPVTFTDGVQRNVHQIRKITFSDAASGSGLFDFGDMVNTRLPLKNVQTATMPASVTVSFEQDKAIFYAAASVDTDFTFDFTNAVPGTVVRVKWTYGSGRAITVTAPSGSTVVKDSGNLTVASATNIIYFLYAGLNAAGNHEVSYSIRQV